MPDPRRIMERCDAFARHSELPGGLTRAYLSREQAAANELVLDWMREAGMSARLDAVGNVVGRLEGARPGSPCLMLGSHLDTVRDAGKYDGMLFVRCAKGISHNSAEAISAADAEIGGRVFLRFIENFRPKARV